MVSSTVMSAIGPSIWDRPSRQALLGVFGCLAAGIVFAAGSWPAILIVFSLILLPTRILILGFVCFSYFRIHEAYTFLLPLKLPLVFSVASMAAILIMFVKDLQSAPKDRRAIFAIAALTTILAAGVLLILGELSSNNAPRLPIALAMLLASVAFYGWYLVLDSMNQPRWGVEMKLFVFFFIAVSIGIIFAQDPAVALTHWNSTYWKIGAMTLVLAWLLRSRLDYQTSIWFIVASGSLIALMTCHNWYFGIDLVEGTRVSIGRTLFSTPDQIANAVPGLAIEGGSLLGDPNDLALVLLFPIALALATIAQSGLRNALGWFCLLALPLLIIAVVMTQSRGGALGVVATFGAIGLVYIRSKMLLATLALIGVFSLGIAMDIGGRSSGGLAELEEAGLDRSATERLHAWTAAVNMTAAYPLTGVGLQNFSSRFREFTPVWVGRNMASHSTWFGVMAETGLPGIGLLLSLIGALLLAIRRTWLTLQRINADPIYHAFCLAIFAGVLGFCAAGTFLSQGFGWPLYLLVGLASALACTARQLDGQADTENSHGPNSRHGLGEHPVGMAPAHQTPSQSG